MQGLSHRALQRDRRRRANRARRDGEILLLSMRQQARDGHVAYERHRANAILKRKSPAATSATGLRGNEQRVANPKAREETPQGGQRATTPLQPVTLRRKKPGRMGRASALQIREIALREMLLRSPAGHIAVPVP